MRFSKANFPQRARAKNPVYRETRLVFQLDTASNSNAFLVAYRNTLSSNHKFLEKETCNTKLVLFGPPGSGKGTYAARLHLKLGIPAIATGDIFREIVKRETKIGRVVAEYMSKGDLIPDNITIAILKKRLVEDDCAKGFILDGYPRTLEQARALDRSAKIDAIVQLVVPKWIIVTRLSNRRICEKCGEVYNLRFLKPKKPGVCEKCGGKLSQRIDDTPTIIKERFEVYESQTKPLLEYYKGKVPIVEFKCESVNIPPEVAVSEILRGLKKLGLTSKTS